MIEVEDLRFAYPGGSEDTVRGIGFQVEPGEIFGFLGPSGAGKSTTQKILIGLLRGFQGRASVLGRDLRRLDPSFYERIGVSFEFPNLYGKLTARENLAQYAALFEGETEAEGPLLERLGLSADADTRVERFSKGMKVRLGFARSLLNRAELLFLDEPTAGLDPVSGGLVKDLIREGRDEGRTVFLTTHDMTVADQLCDRVAFIVDGALVCIEAPRLLKQRHGRRSVRVEYSANGALESREFPIDGLSEDEGFLGLLRGSPIETIHSQETTLEQVFIELTGRSLG